MITVTKQFRISAAHSLPTHEGQCKEFHGHNYVIEVAVSGELDEDPSSPRYGMVIDFGMLKATVWSVLHAFDHTNLNEMIEPSTAEALALYLFRLLETPLARKRYLLKRVRVWETSDSYVTVDADDSVFEVLEVYLDD
jgi:6-pyruvoyltetrahydropterin/6-carboxytetrahydropterin synthase